MEKKKFLGKKKIYRKKKYLRRYKAPVLDGFERRKIEVIDVIGMPNGTNRYLFNSMDGGGKTYADNLGIIPTNFEFRAEAKIKKYFRITGVKIEFRPYSINTTDTLPGFTIAYRPDHQSSALGAFELLGTDNIMRCQVGTGAPVSSRYWKIPEVMGVLSNGICSQGFLETDTTLLPTFLGGSIQMYNLNVGNVTAQRNVGEITVTYYCVFHFNTGSAS